MRWADREIRLHGERRLCSAFLFFPKRAGGEWRWLERATWREHYDDSVEAWFADYWIDGEGSKEAA